MPPIRAAMVARAKRLLAQGYYDNTHVLAFAVARMFDEVRSGRVSPARSHGPTPGREARGPSERAARWSQTAP